MAGMIAAEAALLQVMRPRGVFYAAEAHSSRVGHIGLRGARYSRLWCVARSCVARQCAKERLLVMIGKRCLQNRSEHIQPTARCLRKIWPRHTYSSHESV